MRYRSFKALTDLTTNLKALMGTHRDYAGATGTDDYRFQERLKHRLAAVLYLAGVGLVLYAYYGMVGKYSPAVGYVYLWLVGVILAAIAAMVWPKEDPFESKRDGRGSGDGEGEEA